MYSPRKAQVAESPRRFHRDLYIELVKRQRGNNGTEARRPTGANETDEAGDPASNNMFEVGGMGVEVVFATHLLDDSARGPMVGQPGVQR